MAQSPAGIRAGGSVSWPSTTRLNTTTARGCRSIRRFSRAGRAMAPPIATKPTKEGRAEIGLKYGPSPRQTIDLFKPRGGDRRPARAVHPWRLLALARAVELQPDGARHERAWRHRRGVRLRSRAAGLDRRRSSSRRRPPACFCGSASSKRIMVSGHSAGGHLAACMVATDWKALDASAPADLVPAGYAISGLFDLAPLLHLATNADFKLDAAEARRISPLFWPVARGPRARRRGRRRGIVGVPAAEQDHRRRLAREGRRDALRGGPRHEPLHDLRSDDRPEQRDDEAAGRTGAAEPRTSIATRTPRSAARRPRRSPRASPPAERGAPDARRRSRRSGSPPSSPASAASSPRRWR